MTDLSSQPPLPGEEAFPLTPPSDAAPQPPSDAALPLAPPSRYSALDIARELRLPAPTEQQRAVIEAPLAPALVVAGAGSGKTETMANRVLWLLANGHVQPSQVLGLTFTRKAAGELLVKVSPSTWLGCT